jgi:hypothetical protein
MGSRVTVQLRPADKGVPTVVFVDHMRWAVFNQVAATVRRSGGRAVRVTIQPPDWRNRLIDRLIYSRAIYLDGPDALANLAGLLADENVVDVQATEYVGATLARGDAVTLPGAVGAAVAAWGGLVDKFVVGELASDRGVRSPTKLAADRTTLDGAIAALGLPMVVKGRTGAAGEGVRIVETEADAQRAISELGRDRGRVFFERMVSGDDVGYQAVIGADGIVMDAATLFIDRPPGSTTPPVKIQIVDAPEVVEFGRHATEKLGLTGLVQMDIVRDVEGQCWLLDLNVRAWGSMFSVRSCGVDFGAGYLYSIGLRAEPPRPAVPSPVTVIIFPRVVDEEIARRRVPRTVRAFLTHSFRFMRWLGLRYWSGQLLIAAGSLRAALVRSEPVRVPDQ